MDYMSPEDYLDYISGSPLERKVAEKLREHGLPEFKPQMKVIPGRKFAYDFGWEAPESSPYSGVLLEVQGGIWGKKRKSAHSTGTGITRDQEKVAEAQLHGWIVLQCSEKNIEDGMFLDWVERALERAGIPVSNNHG